MRKPSFLIDHLPIYGNLILAPMDGFSDQPFRCLERQLGSAISYTEFINAIDVVQGHPFLEKRIAFSESERPVAFQFLDNDIDRLEKAVPFYWQVGGLTSSTSIWAVHQNQSLTAAQVQAC